MPPQDATVVTIRAARASDAPALGRVHVAAWHETYADILSAALIADQTVQKRTAMWVQLLTDQTTPATMSVYVAERDGEMIGFGSWAAQRANEMATSGYDGEIRSVYVLRFGQRRGIGRALMRTMASELLESGYHAVNLWVARDNGVARRFYEQLGGSVIGEKEDVRPLGTIVEVAYGWNDIRTLVDMARPVGE